MRFFVTSKLKNNKFDGCENNLTNEWWNMWCKVDSMTLKNVKAIIAGNIFTEETCKTGNLEADKLLAFYLIKRDK